MLYQEKTLGTVMDCGRGWRPGLPSQCGGSADADLDLLSMSPHLQRDIGMDRFRRKSGANEIAPGLRAGAIG